MQISTLDLSGKAHAFAVIAKAAYLDDCGSDLASWGFDQDYQAINRKDANAHVACSDDHIIMAIRGTEPEQLKDLSADLRWWPKNHGPGWVHTGFRRHARKILPDLMEYIKQHPGKGIHITGHSLGAAMALYIAQELEWAGHDNILLFTYGSPRLGNKSYVRNIKNVEHHRYVNGNDLVTKLPPAWLGFRHHGTLHYINRNGVVTDRYMGWKILLDGIKGRLKAWSGLKFLDGLADHGMDSYVRHLARVAAL